MKVKLLSIAIGLSLFAISCKKTETTENTLTKSINDINVPADFNWASTKEVNFSIGVTDTRYGSAIHVIKIYAGDPSNGGQLVSKGSATLTSPFNTKASLPTTLTEVYIVKVAQDNSSVTQKITLTSNAVSASIGSTSNITNSVKVNSVKVNAETSPSCTGTTIPNGSNNYEMLSGQTYNIAENSTVNFKDPQANATLMICGNNVSISGLKIQNNLTVIVTSAGNISSLSNFAWDGTGTFKNFGTVTSSSNFKVSGTLLNQGTFTINGDFNPVAGSTITTATGSTLTASGNMTAIGTMTNGGSMSINGAIEFQSSSNFTNTGTLTLKSNTSISGTFINSGTANWTGGEISFNGTPTVTNGGTFSATNSRLNTAGTFNNNGSVTLQTLQHNSSGVINNNCKFIVLSNAIVDKPINNTSYFKVGGTLTGNGSSQFNNTAGSAMFDINYMDSMDGTIQGSNGASLFKVVSSGAKVNDNGGTIKGTVQYCDPGRTLKTAHFSNGATQDCGLYIATSDCNPVGNGVNNDTDNDGVPNSEDDYPTDPDKAYNTYSVNYANGGSTIAFEDSWPSKGDYDLNDVVITYKYKIATNKANKVVSITADYKLLATGGEFQNGAGIQFHLPAGSAKNLTSTSGAVLESGQDSVVVILFNNSRNQQATWNTKLGESISPNVNYSVSFDVTDGPSIASFGNGPYNPFIWNGSANYGRGYETHLYGKNPTKLATTALLGTRDDNSISGKFYSTANKLPWAIEVPVASFTYPIERTPITDAYLKFGTWAESGGKTFTDWYSNTGNGYRDGSKLFVR